MPSIHYGIPKLSLYQKVPKDATLALIGDLSRNQVSKIVPTTFEETLSTSFKPWQKLIRTRHEGFTLLRAEGHKPKKDRKEHYRQAGTALYEELQSIDQTLVHLHGASSTDVLDAAMGLMFRNYKFQRYKQKPHAFGISEIKLPSDLVSKADLEELNALVGSVYFARDLVNEPANVLTAPELARRIASEGKASGFNVEVLGKGKISALKMGGILSVNQGSRDEPTFSILTYCHPSCKGIKPLVLVGKGVVYDTGGLSLKPTPSSMDLMKCDMAGAAAVAGAIRALSLAGAKVHAVGLIPATDNRVGPDSYSPGDVITMYDGTQVEVMNTDAEGRLLLADALTYAKKYDPNLVIDLATLTGSSMHTASYYGAVAMGTASRGIMGALTKAGLHAYERLVELPLWEEFEKELESDIADVKNLGANPLAGAITAGKFLERFTAYPWIHIDIAGPAFLPAARGYLPKGATGFGVYLLYDFITNHFQH